MTAQEYLAQHGIDEQFALNQGLVWDDNYLNIMVKDEQGNDSFVKSRNLNFEKGGDEPKYKNSSGSQATLFNFYAVKDSPNIVLCEGEIDCLKLIQEGIPSISSTGGAGVFKNEWVTLLGTKNVYICYDNDESGESATRSLLDKFPNAKVIPLPKKYKDICDYFVAGHDRKDFTGIKVLDKTTWKAKHREEEFQTHSAADIAKMEIIEHPWLIENILYSEGFCFIFGAEGVGKSYIALDIARAVATGTPWLDHFPTNKGNVLFLDKENPTAMIKKRIDGLKMNELTNVHWLKYPEKFYLTDYEGKITPFAQELSEIVEEKQIDLIIIDSFVDLVAGNENSSADTQAFFSAIKELYPKIAYLPLHHENKPSAGTFRTDAQRSRGSSNINAQTHTMFRLESVAKSKTEMTLKQTKARDSLKIDKFMIRMIVATNGDKSTTVTGFEYLGEVEDVMDSTKLGELKNNILGIIQTKKHISRKELVETIGFEGSTFKRAIKELLGSGEVDKNRRGKQVWYSISVFTQNDDLEYVAADYDGQI